MNRGPKVPALERCSALGAAVGTWLHSSEWKAPRELIELRTSDVVLKPHGARAERVKKLPEDVRILPKLSRTELHG
jgi:hypothetical protein